MKKFKAMILALSLCAVFVGNQIKLAATDGPQGSASLDFAKNFNLPTGDPEVGRAIDRFQDILMSMFTFSDAKSLTIKFRNFANFISRMSETSKKYFSSVILACPIMLGVDSSLPEEVRARMVGSLLSSIYSDIGSVEWDVDVNNHKGTVNLYMRNIPYDMRMLMGMKADMIQVQGNKISYSF